MHTAEEKEDIMMLENANINTNMIMKDIKCEM